MCSPIFAHYAGPVEGKDDGQIRKTHIVDNLVKGTLEKGGVDGNYRFKALCGQTCGKGYSMLLSDSHIHKAIWIHLGKLGQPRPFRHGRSNGKEPLVPGPKLHHGPAKYLRVRWRLSS